MAATNKICPRCKENKPFEAFSRCTSKRDGRQTECKACRSVREKVRHDTLPPSECARKAREFRAKAKLTPLTAGRLQELVLYDPETGVMSRTADIGSAKTGDPIGQLDRKGYLRGQIAGRTEFVHRLVWLYSYGEWPPNQIDHINGIKDDNRLANLRLATPSQNKQNTPVRRDSGSGLKGVTFDKRARKWRAYIIL